MAKTLICIDPGASGCIAVKYDNGIIADPMPDTIGDLWDYLKFCSNSNPVAYLENVGGYMPGNAGPAAVKFSRHVGHLEMALYAAGIPTTKVAPGIWMKALGVPKLEKADRKRWIKDYVQRHFPSLRVTLNNADALGMLLYVQKK